MAYKNTDYSTSMRGDVTPIKSVMYRTENNIVRPYFMRKVEESGPDYSEPFYIEDISGSDNTVTIRKSDNSAPTITVEKSTDGVNWSTMGSTSRTAITATVPGNGKLYLRASAEKWAYGNPMNNINCNKNFNVGGNILSLRYGSEFNGENDFKESSSDQAFGGIFSGSKTLINANKLLLPIRQAHWRCFYTTFSACTSLITAPILPATSLSKYCYNYMFSYCSSLNSITCLATTYSSDYTLSWLEGVAATGTFITPSSTNWSTGTSGIPSGWTRVDA